MDNKFKDGRITLLIGMPNSGKSTYTRKEISADPENTTSVSRDAIRRMLYSFDDNNYQDYYESSIMKRESIVTKYQNTLIYEGLCDGKHVIIDDTNLQKEHIERIRYFNCPINVMFFDTTLKQAIERNHLSPSPKPEDYLRKCYDKSQHIKNWLAESDFLDSLHPKNRFKIENDNLAPPCIVVDIDGTLAEKNGRNPFDMSRVSEDTPKMDVIRIVRALSKTYKVIICSGREDVCKKDTEDWLRKYGIFFSDVLMRREKDMRPDWVIKQEMWKDITINNNIIGIVDDRMQVVRRARMLGLTVLNVHYNNF